MDRIVLVTGANRGLGLEFVKQLLHKNYRVVATARQSSPELLEFIKQYPNHCEFHPLDLVQAESLSNFQTFVRTLPHLDWVICNAGVMGPNVAKSLDASAEDYESVFKTNVLGPFEVAKITLPKLLESPKPVFASITSLMGSIQENSSGGYGPYRVSKSALNMLNKNLSLEFPQIPFVVLHPGWVQTRMGGSQAPMLPQDSIRQMLEVLEKTALPQSGKFFNYNGKELPW